MALRTFEGFSVYVGVQCTGALNGYARRFGVCTLVASSTVLVETHIAVPDFLNSAPSLNSGILILMPLTQVSLI